MTCIWCKRPKWQSYDYCYEHMMAYSYCDPDAGRDAQREQQEHDDDALYFDLRYGRPEHLGG